MPMPAFDIGIVIVSYNVRHFLENCLQSVEHASKTPLKVEVWVVDNASVDGTPQMVRERFPQVNFISNDKNVGFSTANNQAIRQMSAKYILLLNPDTILEEDTLRKCFDFMEHRPEAGVVGIRMIDGAGKFLPESKRSVPNLWNSFCKLFYLSDLFPKSKRFSGYNLGYLPEMETNKVEVLCGAFMFIRSACLSKVGLLDEAFFMYGEDIDLSYRILLGGYDVWYYPEATIIHYKGESTKKGSFNYIKTFYGAMQIYVDKHYGKSHAGVFAKVIKIAVGIRGVISGLSSLIKSIIHPLLDFCFLFLALLVVKCFWANYYYMDVDYYKKSPTHIVLLIYALVWVFTLWFNGYYEYIQTRKKKVISVVTGMLLILIIYSLLPEYLRTSRAIILLGGMISMPLLSMTSWLLQGLKADKKIPLEENAIAIVASMENAEKLKSVILSSVENVKIYFIAPDENFNNGYFANSINNLPKIIRKLKISEVIYGSEDVPINVIINSMSIIGAGIAYKIGSAETLKIIGSGDRNSNGELLSLDVKYKLDINYIRRAKRLLDICISLFMIPLSIIWIFLNGFSLKIFNWIGNVLIGRSTWIGYGGTVEDFEFLPPLPNAIFPLSALIENASDIKQTNIEYARNYNVFYDLKMTLKKLFVK